MKTCNIFWFILAPIDNFMVNFSKSYPFKGARDGYVCMLWLDSSPHTESMLSETSPSTELTRCEISHQLSQHGVRLHINWVNAEGTNIYWDFIIPLMWSFTLCWLSQCGVSLGVDAVDGEWDSASNESPLNVKNFE